MWEEEAESRRPSESRRLKPLAESRREEREDWDDPASNPGGDGRGEVARCDQGNGALSAAEGAGGGAETGVVDLLASASGPEVKRLGDPTAEGPDTEMEMEARERECP